MLRRPSAALRCGKRPNRATISLCSALDDNTQRFAVLHRDIVARFGRFPHRNAALGRRSTPEEQQFLDQGGFAG